MLKVHQVHEYTYTTLSEGEGQRVELACHGGIDTPKYSTQETFTTTENRYVKWTRDTDFEPTHWDMEGLHICRPKKQVLDSGKHGPETVSKKKKEHAKVSAFQQDIIKFANEWAYLDYTKDSDIETTYFKKLEQTETLEIVIDSLGWARKKQLPSVSIPPPIKNELVTLYNVKPTCQIDSITAIHTKHIRRICNSRS